MLGLLKGVWGRHGGNRLNDFQIKSDNFQIKSDDFRNKSYDFQSLEASQRAGATERGRGEVYIYIYIYIYVVADRKNELLHMISNCNACVFFN